MNTKHTPGPWRAILYGRGPSFPSYHAVSFGGNGIICRLGEQPRDEANARRIVECVNACEGIADPTAVPEVLEALQLTMKTFEGLGAIHNEAYRQARAAVAKATGETI